jgi:ABC-type Fe3+-hydroxamate transport system substrate-binding protein
VFQSSNHLTKILFMIYRDAVGTVHQPYPGARIVSLVPSITELLCELGLAPQLVGRTGFCIHPADRVASIAKVGGTKDVNLAKIGALAPTHVILNIDENTRATAAELAQSVPHLVVTHPLAPQDNLKLAELLGGVFCVPEQARRWCAAFAQAYRSLQAEPKGAPLTVLYCIWQDPWMTVSDDTYIARMLAEIGWRLPLLGAARYPVFDWSSELVDRIDGVLLATEPYRFTEQHADALERHIGKPVVLVDGEMLSWYGSRAVAGLAYLRDLVRQRPLG